MYPKLPGILTRKSQASGTFPSLPAEIWHHIALFIPFSYFQTSRLYTINRYLLGYYLNEKYRNISLSFVYGSRESSPGVQFSEQLKRLQCAPLIFDFPRSLEISVREHASVPALYQPPLSPPQKFRFITQHLNSFRRLKTSPDRSIRAEANAVVFPVGNLKAVFSKLCNLTSIECCLFSFEETPTLPFATIFPSVISLAWTASNASLTTINLSFKLKTIPSLSLDGVYFPELYDFRITVSPLSSTMLPDGPLARSLESTGDPLLQFLSRHKDQITRFSFGFPASRFLVDFLNNMPHFSRLEDLAFTLCAGVNTPTLRPLSTFLTRHSDNIRRLKPDLALDPYVPPVADNSGTMSTHLRVQSSSEWWKTQEIFNVSYPSLRQLSFRYTPIMESLTLWRLANLSETLVELELQSYVIYPELERLLAVLESSKHLRTLRIFTQAFSTVLLKLLVNGTPHLKILDLSHYGIGVDERPRISISALMQACESISSHPYPDWSLEVLNLDNRREVGHCKVSFRTAVVHALPSVKCINGVGQREYINSGGCMC